MMTLQTTQDTLVQSLDELRQALAAQVPGREREWAGDTSRAVALLVTALLQRQAATAAPDGLFAGVDLTRSTLARQVGAMGQHLGELLEQSRLLGKELNAAAEAFLPIAHLPRAHSLPPPSTRRAIPHFGALRRAADELLEALNRYQEQETKLILDSVNTEIGVGD